MASQTLLLLALCFVFIVKGEYLTKKFCNDASPHECEVYNVILDPCVNGGSFCTIKRTKRYTLSIDFMPKFAASRLNMSIYGDDTNSGTFAKTVKAPADACNILTCPVEAQMRRIFDVDFSLGKTFNVGKYAIKVKLYNSANEKEGCCFTFNVKILK